MNHFSENEPLDIDLVSNEAPMTLFFNHLRPPPPRGPSSLLYICLSCLLLYHLPSSSSFFLTANSPFSLGPRRASFHVFEVWGTENESVRAWRGGGEEQVSVHASRCVCARKCVVAACCVRGSLSGPDGQKKSTKRSDWGCGCEG